MPLADLPPFTRLSSGTNPRTHQQWALDYVVLVSSPSGERVILFSPITGPLDDVDIRRARQPGWLLRREDLEEMLKSLDAPPACTCDEEDDADADA